MQENEEYCHEIRSRKNFDTLIGMIYTKQHTDLTDYTWLQIIYWYAPTHCSLYHHHLVFLLVLLFYIHTNRYSIASQMILDMIMTSVGHPIFFLILTKLMAVLISFQELSTILWFRSVVTIIFVSIDPCTTVTRLWTSSAYPFLSPLFGHFRFISFGG